MCSRSSRWLRVFVCFVCCYLHPSNSFFKVLFGLRYLAGFPNFNCFNCGNKYSTCVYFLDYNVQISVSPRVLKFSCSQFKLFHLKRIHLFPLLLLLIFTLSLDLISTCSDLNLSWLGLQWRGQSYFFIFSRRRKHDWPGERQLHYW